MRVLSLFDGMSCAQIALKELGIFPEVYYASEIDKFAISQTMLNFPDTVQLGDVENWWLWDIDFSRIDLICAGSPCQGFSFAGKGLAFDDPRSKLFFVFIEIMDHCKKLNPDVKFVLENVNMKKEYRNAITELCGVQPLNINSKLVSAQNRNRWYWTNIEGVHQPEDEEIYLRDILEKEVDEKYYISKKNKEFMSSPYRPSKKYTQINGEKGLPAMARQYSSWNGDYIKIKRSGKISPDQDKSSCFTAGAHSGGNHSDMDLICMAMRGREDSCLTPRRIEYGKSIRKGYEAGKINERRGNIQQLEPRSDGKTNCIISVQKDNLILQRSRGNNKGGLFEGKTPTLSACSWEQNNLLCERQRRNYKSQNEKANAFLSTSHKGSQANGMTLVNGAEQIDTYRIRRLTPTECSRLQTIPYWYKWGCSDTQAYKMLGNGWTVKVISHILQNFFPKIIR